MTGFLSSQRNPWERGSAGRRLRPLRGIFVAMARATSPDRLKALLERRASALATGAAGAQGGAG